MSVHWHHTGLSVIICRKYPINYRSHSNFEDAETSPTEDVASAAGVENVQDVEEEVVTPPDHMVAIEIDAIENRGKAVTASSSRTVGPSRLHIQKPRAKKMTETVKQRQYMHNSFLQILQRDQERELRPDDEIDSSFFGFANRMRLHLNQDQKEVLQEINRVVTQAINNVRAGLPPINNMFLQPPPMQQMGNPSNQPPPIQQMGNPPDQPPPMQQMGNPPNQPPQMQQPFEYPTYTALNWKVCK